MKRHSLLWLSWALLLVALLPLTLRFTASLTLVSTISTPRLVMLML